MSDKDYSLLRPFDLEAAKRGEPFCDKYGVLRKIIAGPDIQKAYVVEDERGIYRFSQLEDRNYHMPPLCWVEGKPVYKGDVLWGQASNGDWHEFKAEGTFEHHGSLVLYPDDGRDGWLPLSRLRWTPPKVKREGWVNVWPKGDSSARYFQTCVFDTQELAYLGACALPGRIACVRIEWEEPA